MTHAFVPVCKPLIFQLVILCAVHPQQLQLGTEEEASHGCRIPASCLLSWATVPLINYPKRKKKRGGGEGRIERGEGGGGREGEEEPITYNNRVAFFCDPGN